MKLDDVILKYGPIENSKWANETKWCMLWKLPMGLLGPRHPDGTLVTDIYINKDFQPLLQQALYDAQAQNIYSQIKTIDGVYCVRNIRGEIYPSAHSWAAAIDINAADNPLGSDGQMSAALVKCFTDAGLGWGGLFPRKDPMHMTYLGF